ncbi:MAG: YezD family protein [Pseudomonadota bacterium]
MTKQTTSVTTIRHEEQVWQYLREAVKELRYGSVEVIVHDGKVVQIERREKLRFEK